MPFLVFFVLSFSLGLSAQEVPAGCNYYNQTCYSSTAAICATTDDMHEVLSGWVGDGGALIFSATAEPRQVGLRFKEVVLPPNAIIKNAYIQFSGSGNSENGISNLSISGEDLTQNSITFTAGVTMSISSRPKTTASVTWLLDSYRNAAYGERTRTSDVSSIINEFYQDGWTSGNPMTFIITGDALRKDMRAFDYLDGQHAPSLYIEYSLPVPTCSGVSGFVYNDYNDNGLYDVGTIDLCENGISAITVNLYDCDGFVGTAVTDSQGNWTYPASINDTLRVEYVYPESYKPAKASSTLSSTETAFIVAPECCLDFGLHQAKEYKCENPQVLMVCHVRCYVTDAASYSTILSIAESDKSNSITDIADYQSTVFPVNITLGETGTLWGLDYNKESDVIYGGAFWANSSTVGPANEGGIYCVDNSTNDGTDGSVTDANVSTLITIPNAGTEPVVCSNNDPTLVEHSMKIGLGDLDLNCTNDTLYTINLNTRQLVCVPVDGCTVGTPAYYDLPTPVGTHQCTGDVIRPFGLTYHEGKLYVGAVCTAENSKDSTNLWAYVYEYTEGGGFNATPVLDFRLDYQRGQGSSSDNPHVNWQAWQDVFDASNPFAYYVTNSTIVHHPQPMLTDIEFDKGDMVLGFSDRFAYQWDGGPDPTGIQTSASAVPSGDILRAGYNGNDTWTIENNATVSGLLTGDRQTIGANKDLGPGGGEYYHDEEYSAHTEVAIGALAMLPGCSDIVSTAYDPASIYTDATSVTRFGSGGLQWYNNTNGDNTYAWEGYDAVTTFDFGKGNGFGDVEYICDCPPIEIGNRVWCDIDGDGLQDAKEPSVPSVVLNIYDVSGTLVGTTTTDAEGRYYFNSSNVTGGLLPNESYYIGLDGSNFNTAGALEIGGIYYGILTDTDNSTEGQTDTNDSDAVLPTTTASGVTAIDNTVVPYIPVMTGDYGCNDFTFDFGFYKCPDDECFTINLVRN